MIKDSIPRVVIIDYGISNLFSVKQACERAGLYPIISSDKSEIFNFDAAILPGVGAFATAMDKLKKLDLVFAIKDFIAGGKLFLGICLGMQLLMSESEEFGVHQGLDIFRGNVIKFPHRNHAKERIKVPHIGWNKVYFANNSPPIFNNINDGEFMYFVHSYFVSPSNEENIISTTNYRGIHFCSGINRNNVFAFQFHPEKSANAGLTIYKNFKELIKGGHL